MRGREEERREEGKKVEKDERKREGEQWRRTRGIERESVRLPHGQATHPGPLSLSDLKFS